MAHPKLQAPTTGAHTTFAAGAGQRIERYLLQIIIHKLLKKFQRPHWTCTQFSSLIGQMLGLDDYNSFCAALPHVTTVVQWGGAHVWKVGGKVFAIGSRYDGPLAVSFKVTRLSFEILRETDGCRPAPYLASRGMLWIQCHGEGLSDADLKAYITQSHQLVAAGLTKKLQQQLGFL